MSLGWRKIKKAARLAPENVGRYQISWLQGIHLNTDNTTAAAQGRKRESWVGAALALVHKLQKIDISETGNNVSHFKY